MGKRVNLLPSLHVKHLREYLKSFCIISLDFNVHYCYVFFSFSMSQYIKILSSRFKTLSVTSFYYQQHHRHFRLYSNHLLQNYHSKNNLLQYNLFVKFSKLDLWSHHYKGKKLKKFEELAYNLAKKKTIKDIIK